MQGVTVDVSQWETLLFPNRDAELGRSGQFRRQGDVICQVDRPRRQYKPRRPHDLDGHPAFVGNTYATIN